MIIVPLVFALLALIFGKTEKAAKQIAIIGTLVTLAVSLQVLIQYVSPAGQNSLTERSPWIPGLGANYFVTVDGLSLFMVLMTTVIWPFVVGASGDVKERTNQYYFWVLMMEAAVLGVFVSMDLLLFYVFWEAMLIPMYFIIGMWGGAKRKYATIKFFLYTMVGSMVMLISILAMYFLSPAHSFDLDVLQKTLPAVMGTGPREMLLFIGFFLAFGIKAPIWPFHTWVPDAYSEAPTGGSIMLVTLKMGLYGILRFCLPLFPHAVKEAAPLIIVLSVIGVIYAAWVASMQTDLKRLIAYSSVSHIGVIMLAIFALSASGISGGILQMVSHTITTGALFIILGGLYARRGTYAISEYGGLMKSMPGFTVVFLIATLSSVALPLTAGFSGEFLMLIGSFQHAPVATGFATTAAIWSVVYMLWMFQRVMYGKVTKPENENLPNWLPGELAPLAVLVVLIFALGVYPKPILDLVQPAVNATLAPFKDDYAAPAVAKTNVDVVGHVASTNVSEPRGARL